MRFIIGLMLSTGLLLQSFCADAQEEKHPAHTKHTHTHSHAHPPTSSQHHHHHPLHLKKHTPIHAHSHTSEKTPSLRDRLSEKGGVINKPVTEKQSPHHRIEHHFHEWHLHHFQNPHLIHRSIVFAENTEQGIIGLIHRAIEALHHTSYRYGGNYFDMSHGIYELDCSDYVDDLLRISKPRAYQDLACATHTEKPTSRDYFRFFNTLSNTTDPGHYWQRVDDVHSLKAGDILVFQNYGGSGHVMVVMSPPAPALNDDNTYFVRVSDSANSRHSDDTRPLHVSGVGIGTLLLKTDPDSSHPMAYAWTVDSGWDNVRIAMAEPESTP